VNTRKSFTRSIVFMSTFTNTVTVRNFGLISDKFKLVEICTNGRYSQRCVVNCVILMFHYTTKRVTFPVF
jgi:hypothetical protein